jgi:glutamine synthetase
LRPAPSCHAAGATGITFRRALPAPAAPPKKVASGAGRALFRDSVMPPKQSTASAAAKAALDAARQRVADSGHTHVKVAITDIDGVLRGKYMARDKFLAALDDGFGFCDVVLGWDIADGLYGNSGRVTGWHTGFPDAAVRVAAETGRGIPFEDGVPLFLGAFTGDAAAVCPRSLLRRVIARAGAMGFDVRAAFEYEFFLFRETPQSVRAKNFSGLEPMAPGKTGYSLLRATTAADFYRDLLSVCDAMDMPLEGLHEEMGAGVLEAAITVTDALAAADRAVLFKTFAKAVAQRHGLMASFMARWSEAEAGQSGHIHLSLTKKRGGAPVFPDPKSEDGMSATMRHFVAGQQALMPELCALYAPTVNSYRRLQPGAWAPSAASWGHDNRTVALRVIGAKGANNPKASRIEFRAAGADANPYLALAAALAAGLHGIENALDPTPPATGNAYEAKLPQRLLLPVSLDAAATRLRASAPARDWFGDIFVDHFADSRDWEAQEFARAVTDWELQRYFELI